MKEKLFAKWAGLDKIGKAIVVAGVGISLVVVLGTIF